MAFKELKTEAGVSLGYLQTDAQERLGVHNLLHVQDQKAVGVNGGAFTSGAWRTRELNTVILNNITAAELASNRVKLPTGKYYCEGSSVQYLGGANVSYRLFNITSNSAIFHSICSGLISSNTTPVITQKVSLSGVFELTSESYLELQHITSITGTYGFGFGSTETVNIYSDLKIWKVS